LRTNGRDAFVFWIDDRLRVRRLVHGEKELGRPIFDLPVTDAFTRFDAVWTGDHFLVAIDTRTNILGRIVDANGVPIGEPFTIADHAAFWHMASNGKYVLTLTMGDNQAITLTPDGRPSGLPGQQVPPFSATAPVVTSNGTGFAALFTTGSGQKLLTFDANGQIVTERLITSDFGGNWSIASDGNRYLAVSSYAARSDAYLVNSDGSAVATMAVDESPSLFFGNPTAVWTGSNWAIAYDAAGQSTSEVRLANLNAASQTIVSRQALPFDENWAIAALGGHLVGTWTDAGTIQSGEVPLTAGAESVAFAAARQGLMAAASSADASLAVWHELDDGKVTTRAGTRTRSGLWREEKIDVASATAIAASDGQEFVVILGNQAIFLDRNAKPLRSTTIAAFTPSAVAWNGSNYGLIGIFNGAMVTALLSSDGSVSDARVISAAQQAVAPSIASDGSGFFATWFTSAPCGPIEDLCIPTSGLSGIHLDAELRPTDPNPTIFAAGENVIPGAGVAWNGKRYVVAWSSLTKGVAAASIGASGPPEIRVLSPRPGASISISTIDGAAAIGWSDLTTADYLAAIVRDDGQLAGPDVIHQEPAGVSSIAQLTAFANGELMLAYSSPQTAAPQHGTTHVMMAIGTLALPPLPSAPLLTVRRETATANLEWTAPPQPVAGYRVEYRIGDGLWTEVDTWLDATQRTLSIPLTSPGNTYSFRVRAWNDAGAGAYSASGAERRRAAR
jgi:hypothetical protein